MAVIGKLVPTPESVSIGVHPWFLTANMKLVRGRSLKDILKYEQMSLDRLLAIFTDAASAVAYAHSRGVIHRDLKPANIMVEGFRQVLVMDWGLAFVAGRTHTAATAARSPDSSTITRVGQVVGTPSYMAPEQARGEKERIDERTDVYALGVLLYTTISRKLGFWRRFPGSLCPSSLPISDCAFRISENACRIIRNPASEIRNWLGFLVAASPR